MRLPCLDPTPCLGPIFERFTSPLYQSNDGRLKISEERRVEPTTYSVVDEENGETVLWTHERVLADAFVAGYDLATEGTNSPEVPPAALSEVAA